MYVTRGPAPVGCAAPKPSTTNNSIPHEQTLCRRRDTGGRRTGSYRTHLQTRKRPPSRNRPRLGHQPPVTVPLVTEHGIRIALTRLAQSQLKVIEDVHTVYYELYFNQQTIRITAEDARLLKDLLATPPSAVQLPNFELAPKE